MATNRSYNFDAVCLEAMYQLCRRRGMNYGRRRFVDWGRSIVEGMVRRGELPLEL